MATEPSKEAVETADDWTKPPFLRRVRIRGYKSIAFCDVTLEPLTILVGRNASGKSNFLDALAFLRDAMATNITEATKQHGGWHSILSRFSPSGEIAFEVEVSLPAPSPPPRVTTGDARPRAEYGFTLREGPSESPALIREWFRSPVAGGNGDCHYDLTGTYDPATTGMGYTWEFVHPKIKCSQAPYPHPDHLWVGSFGERPFLDLWTGLRHMTFYNFIPEIMRRPQPATGGQLLDRNGWNLASVIEATRGSDPWTIDRVGRYLSVITKSVELLGAAKYGDYKMLRFRVAGNGTGQPLEFDAASMSDGTLRVLAALVAAFQIVLPHGSPSLVGIEEPETSLHPAAMRALVDALDEATLRTQILLTTHSADMLDNPTIRPENIRVVQMVDGQTIIGPVDEAGVEIVARRLNSLGGLERENQLEPDLDDQDRQRQLARARQEDRP
jgi:predicted ATPase